MKVYVVYEPCDIAELVRGVFGSMEKAEVAVKKYDDDRMKSMPMAADKQVHKIQEYELNEVNI